MREDALPRVGRLGLDRAERALAPDLGRTVREGGTHRTAVLESDGGGERLFLKQHRSFPRRDALFDRLAGRARNSPASVEAENLLALARLGFVVPEPLAFGAVAGGGSFVLVQPVEGRTLEEAFRDAGLSPAARRRLAGNLAALVSRFHALGWFHRDLYLNHAILRSDGSIGLLDLARARRAKRLPRRWRVKDLAALLRSAPRPPITRADALRFLLDYLARDRLDRAGKRLARAVARKAARMAAHRPRHG